MTLPAGSSYWETTLGRKQIVRVTKADQDWVHFRKYDPRTKNTYGPIQRMKPHKFSRKYTRRTG